MSPLTVSLVAFGCITCGALLGMRGFSLLPEHHRDSDTKEAVRLGMGFVGTTVALVLGLLIASADTFYATQKAEITQLAANLVLLDRMLAHYGTETKDARLLLRSTVAEQANVNRSGGKSSQTDLTSGVGSRELLLDKIEELSPQNDDQRLLKTQALDMAINVGGTRWLMFEQKTSSVPMPLVAALVFWLTLLFFSYALFVRPNVTVAVSLLASAVVACGAIFLILEMYQPSSGLIHLSNAPFRAALERLGQ